MVSAVRKLIILSDNCRYWILVFLVEYCQNAKSLQDHNYSVCNYYVGGATSSHKTDDLSYFCSLDIGVQIIDVFNN